MISKIKNIKKIFLDFNPILLKRDQKKPHIKKTIKKFKSNLSELIGFLYNLIVPLSPDKYPNKSSRTEFIQSKYFHSLKLTGKFASHILFAIASVITSSNQYHTAINQLLSFLEIKINIQLSFSFLPTHHFSQTSNTN